MSNIPYIPGSQNQSYTFERTYPLKTDEIARLLEELVQECEEMNQLLRIVCYVLLEATHGDKGVLGINPTALLLGLDPSRRKRKNHNTGFGEWHL